MTLPIARLMVATRGMVNRLIGRSMHASGLTVPCRGCTDASPHDSHLAAGALVVLGSRSR